MIKYTQLHPIVYFLSHILDEPSTVLDQRDHKEQHGDGLTERVLANIQRLFSLQH